MNRNPTSGTEAPNPPMSQDDTYEKTSLVLELQGTFAANPPGFTQCIAFPAMKWAEDACEDAQQASECEANKTALTSIMPELSPLLNRPIATVAPQAPVNLAGSMPKLSSSVVVRPIGAQLNGALPNVALPAVEMPAIAPSKSITFSTRNGPLAPSDQAEKEIPKDKMAQLYSALEGMEL